MNAPTDRAVGDVKLRSSPLFDVFLSGLVIRQISSLDSGAGSSVAAPIFPWSGNEVIPQVYIFILRTLLWLNLGAW